MHTDTTRHTDASSPAALQARGLFKRYGATQALRDVSISLRRGEVTALAGGNGAGKSTLIRVLTGVERADEGELLRDGLPIRLGSPHEATKAGIFCVYQDQPFAGNLRVFEQVYLGYEQRFRRGGAISNSMMRRACEELLADLGLESISPTSPMDSISPAARAVVALASVIAVSRLLEVQNPVILLDEPTSALSAEELTFLIGFINSLKARSALMFVSHRVSEVLDWSDAVYVLRDAANADYMTRETASEERVHRAMGGQVEKLPQEPVAEHFAVAGNDVTTGSRAFAARSVRLRALGPTFDFSVRPGEIVGLAGVEGSGKEDLLRLCAGIKGDTGAEYDDLQVNGETHSGRLRELLGSGVVYLSGDRQRDGVFGRLTIAENMAVSRRVASSDKSVVIRRGGEQARASALVSKLSVKAASVNALLQSLSGGNQQKVLLGRCLELAPRVMLLDNVTRGVDVGAKETIYEVLRSLTADGVAVVFASDDLDELTAVADRIVVFKGGHLAREFDNASRRMDQVDVLAAMI
jgi:ABC-type sugar transport system ATPase subunit